MPRYLKTSGTWSPTPVVGDGGSEQNPGLMYLPSPLMLDKELGQDLYDQLPLTRNPFSIHGVVFDRIDWTQEHIFDVLMPHLRQVASGMSVQESYESDWLKGKLEDTQICELFDVFRLAILRIGDLDRLQNPRFEILEAFESEWIKKYPRSRLTKSGKSSDNLSVETTNQPPPMDPEAKTLLKKGVLPPVSSELRIPSLEEVLGGFSRFAEANQVRAGEAADRCREIANKYWEQDTRQVISALDAERITGLSRAMLTKYGRAGVMGSRREDGQWFFSGKELSDYLKNPPRPGPKKRISEDN